MSNHPGSRESHLPAAHPEAVLSAWLDLSRRGGRRTRVYETWGAIAQQEYELTRLHLVNIATALGLPAGALPVPVDSAGRFTPGYSQAVNRAFELIGDANPAGAPGGPSLEV